MLFNYCDIRFFEDFFRKKPMDLELMTSDAKNWKSFYEYGLNKKHSFIIINLSKDEALAQLQTNPIVKKLFDLYNNSQIDLKFDKNIAEKLKTVDFCKTCNSHSVFFLDNTDAESDNLEKQTGLLFFNLSNHLKKWGKYSPDSYTDIIAVKPTGEFNHWNYMTLLKHSCNSFILIDRYLFAESYEGGVKVTDNYKANVKQLFQYLLPKNDTNLTTDIMLICSEQDTSPSLTLQQIKTYIVNTIFTPLFPNSKFNLSIILVDKFQVPESHDRQIFTNYFNLHSGNSFTYVTNAHPQQIRPKLDTSLHIYSFFSKKSLQEAKSRLNDIKSIVNSANNCIGTKQNRLLS